MKTSFTRIGLILGLLIVLAVGCGVPPATATVAPIGENPIPEATSDAPQATLAPGAPTPTVPNPTGYNLNPCSLLSSANVSLVIEKSNPPKQNSGVDPATNVTTKKCDYVSQKGDAFIKIRLQEDPQVPSLATAQFAALKGAEGYVESDVNGAKIGMIGKAGDGPGFTAFILKGNISVSIQGTALGYKFDANKVMGMLGQVAAKLP